MSPPDWHDRVWIDGWRSGAGGTRDVREPATGTVLGSIGIASTSDTDQAAQTARGAGSAWAGLSPAQRGRVLHDVVEVLEDEADRYQRWLVREAGATQAKARRELRAAAAELHHAATLAARPTAYAIPGPQEREQAVERLPVGTVGVITPFNAPLVLAMRSVAPALATGNTVLLKPDPRTAVSGGLLLAEMFARAGLPAAVLSVLPGDADVGAHLSGHPEVDALLFTGSTRAGAAVGAAAGGTFKKVGLELGGNNPVIVLEDADIPHAVDCAVRSSFLHQGQICMSAGRYLVDDQVVEEFTDRLAQAAQGLRIGDPHSDHEVDLGPLIDEASARRVAGLVEGSLNAGARRRCGDAPSGPWFPATVLDLVPPDSPAWTEELFGPVAPIHGVADQETARRLALDSPYALVAAIHSTNLARARQLADRLPFGTVRINDVTNHDQPDTPMVGRRHSGNGAGFGGVEILELLTMPKLTSWIHPAGV